MKTGSVAVISIVSPRAMFFTALATLIIGIGHLSPDASNLWSAKLIYLLTIVFVLFGLFIEFFNITKIGHQITEGNKT